MDSLSKAKNQLVSVCKHLRINDDDVCGCGKSRNPLQGVISDAGQCFEQITDDAVEDALQYLMDAARARGIQAVCVLLRAKRKAWCVKHCNGGKWHLLRLDQLVAITRAYMKLKYVSFGTGIWRQDKGTPIGGYMSSCITELVMAVDEERYSQLTGELMKGTSYRVDRQGNKQSVPSQHLQDFARARYVDDEIVLSSTACKD